MSNIPRIEVPRSVIRDIPRTVIHTTPPPVVRGISPPVIDVPSPVIEYPTIDVPTREEFEGQLGPQQDDKQETSDETRDLPTNSPQVPQPPAVSPTVTPPETLPPMIPGTDIPAPEMAPLVAAGATAVVTTSVALTAGIVLNKLKDTLLEPLIKRLSNPKKKVKIKQVKPVLHFVLDDDGGVDIYRYSTKGTKLIDTTQDVERYLRDQIEVDALYEYDNKIIIDDVIKDKFTKEGAKRFKSLFAPAKTIAKKLSAKFSI